MANFVFNTGASTIKDKVVLSNPGTLLVSIEQFFQGQQSECRNPVLQKMFVFMGIGEKAGSGADIIVKGWKDNKWVKPLLEEKNEPDRVVLTLGFDKVDKAESLSSHQAVTKLSPSSRQVVTKLSLSIPMISYLLQKMTTPMSAKEMRLFCGQKDHTYFKVNVIDPLIAEKLIAMSHPDKPTSPSQKYFLTESGLMLLDWMKRVKSESDEIN
jgi:hypothetical protein